MLLLGLSASLLTLTTMAAESYGDVTISRVVKVIDGDTFVCDIDGWPAVVGKRVSIRIYGIDTAEKRDPDPALRSLSFLAKDFTAARLGAAKAVTLKDIRRDKYFRLLAQVSVDGGNLGAELVTKKLALPYFGETKRRQDFKALTQIYLENNDSRANVTTFGCGKPGGTDNLGGGSI